MADSDPPSSENKDNTEINDGASNELKGFSKAFKTVTTRKSKLDKLKNRKKSKLIEQNISAEAKLKAKLLKKHHETIRHKLSRYDPKVENSLKELAKRGVIHILKNIYRNEFF